MLFHQPAAVDADFIIPDELQQRIDVGLLHGTVAGKAVGGRQGLDRDVVTAAALAADRVGRPDAVGDKAVERIGSRNPTSLLDF